MLPISRFESELGRSLSPKPLSFGPKPQTLHTKSFSERYACGWLRVIDADGSGEITLDEFVFGCTRAEKVSVQDLGFLIEARRAQDVGLVGFEFCVEMCQASERQDLHVMIFWPSHDNWSFD